MGAWIEMKKISKLDHDTTVAPSWGRGLKFGLAVPCYERIWSPPHGGVDWNETTQEPTRCRRLWGRPLMGAWIEMLFHPRQILLLDVAPSWGRGLKCSYTCIRRLPEHNEYFQPVRKKSSLTGCFVMPIFKLLKFLQLFSFWGLTLFAGFPASPNPVFRSKAAFSVYSSSKIPFYWRLF